MYNSENLQEKWQPVLNHPDLPEITDSYKKAVTAVILENQERELKESRQMLQEASISTGTDIANFDPVLISLVRRAMPSLIAYDVCGVQPMTGPTGLIFAMKARLDDATVTADAEILHDEADTSRSSRTDQTANAGSNPGALNGGQAGATQQTEDPDIWGVTTPGVYNVTGGHTTSTSEGLNDSTFQDMGFSIEKATVTARARALRAGYTMELAQDLKAIHGLDAESELSNILSQEILQEINREVIRTIYITAEVLRVQLLVELSTLIWTLMVVGQLRSSKDCCSKSKKIVTQSESELAGVKETLYCVPLTQHLLCQWPVFLIMLLQCQLILMLILQEAHSPEQSTEELRSMLILMLLESMVPVIGM